MTFNYISSKRILANLYSDFGLQFEGRLGDMLEWIGQAVEYINATAQYIDKVEDVTIHNHRSLLPCDFVEITQAVLNNSTVLSYATSTNRNVVPDSNSVFTSYNTYSIQDNHIIFSVSSGTAQLYYIAFKTDDEGYPMVPDKVRYTEAISYYILYKVKQAEYLSGRINFNELTQLRLMWQRASKEAAVSLQMPTPEKMYSLGKRYQRLVPIILSHQGMFAETSNLQRFD